GARDGEGAGPDLRQTRGLRVPSAPGGGHPGFLRGGRRGEARPGLHRGRPAGGRPAADSAGVLFMSAKKHSILIVDDEQENINLLSNILGEEYSLYQAL